MLEGLRIVHVVRQYRPGVGGLEAVVEALAQAQRSRGMDARVVTLDRIFGAGGRLPSMERIDGVPVSRVGFVGSRRYPIAPGVLKRLRGAALVHVHGVDFLSDFLAFTRPVHRRPMVLSTHGGFFHTTFAAGLKRFWFATVTRLALHAYGFVAASSRSDEQSFRSLRRRGIAPVENGVDVRKFAGAGGDAGRRTIIYFGRLAPNKGMSELLQWFARLTSIDRGWRLIIAGRPMGVSIETLAAQAEQLGVRTQVEFHDTPSDADLRRLIARASVYACASHYEGFGLAAVEAASAGLLPVLSPIPAFERTVQRLGEGLLIDFGDPEAPGRFLSAWRSWGKSPDRRARLTAAVAALSWTQVARGFERVYARVLGLDARAILGVELSVLNRRSAIEAVHRALEEKRPLTVAFCNAHTLNIAAKDRAYAAALNKCLLLNDGVGVDLASRLLFGKPFPENLNGTDFTPAFLSQTLRPLRLFLLGARPHVVNRAAEVIGSRWPRHEIVGVHHGFFPADDSAAVARSIAVVRPDVVLIAMGNPRQELWAVEHCSRLPAISLCVGALFDFLSGEVPRAPLWMRRLRIEWMYRLLHEPGRLWRRYLIGNAAFLARVLRQKWEGHLA